MWTGAKIKVWLAVLAGLALGPNLQAAIGCTLSNPAQDLKYLFPDLTTYREELNDLSQRANGREIFAALRDRLGSDLDPVYETFETPYTVYRIFKGEAVIGIVHGVNVPGRGGVIQVFLSVDPLSGEIRRLFFQRLESPAAKALRAKSFLAQFAGLTLADFYKHDYYAVAEPTTDKDRVAAITSPSSDAKALVDFAATVRGVRKNLILLDVFAYSQRSEPFFRRAQEALAALKTGPAPVAAPGATAPAAAPPPAAAQGE